MAVYNLVFVNPNGVVKNFELKTAFHQQNAHIKPYLDKVTFNDTETEVFIWGENVYTIGTINNPIKMFGKLYQIVELVKFGHIFIVETSDDKGKTWDSIFESRTYLSYNECYDDMKNLAMCDLAADIDIEQDFEEFGSNITYKRNVEFMENQVEWVGGGKIMRYRIIQ